MSISVERRRILSRGDIPGSDGGIYNPGALRAGHSILLLCRREIDYRFTRFVFPELITLDARTLEVVRHVTLRTVGYDGARLEDFRCIECDGERLVVHSVVGRGRIKPSLSRMFADALQNVDDLDLPLDQTPVEKNWVLFVHGGTLHCLYALDPLTIFARTAERTWRLVCRELNGWSREYDRTLSNSTNLIPFEGGYLGFWHTILEGGRYIQGAFWLGPDLSIQYRTGVLLNGRDVVDGHKPGVLYVSSLLEQAGRLLAFYGEADEHTGVAIFDRDELWAELRRVPFAGVAICYEGVSLADAFRAVHALEAFSAERGNQRIQLFVSDDQLRFTLERLAGGHVVVRAGRGESCGHRLIGGSGRIIHVDAGEGELA